MVIRIIDKYRYSLLHIVQVASDTNCERRGMLAIACSLIAEETDRSRTHRREITLFSLIHGSDADSLAVLFSTFIRS